MATLKDVAAETGLTVSTVSRVLNNRGYISEETKKKVFEAMKKLNYTPNELARSLSKQSNNTIGLIVPHIRHPYFAELISHVENAAYKKGHKVLLFNSQEKNEKENEYIEMCRSNRVSGIILCSGTVDLDKFSGLNIPVVTIERFIENGTAGVECDNNQGGRLAAKHLIELGCKNLLHISGVHETLMPADKRASGFIEVCEEEQIKYNVVATSAVDYNRLEYHEVLEKALLEDKSIDGVFTSSDLIAAQLIQVCAKLKIDVPRQLKIVGFDDVNISRFTTPTITTIHQPIKEMAEAAVTCLVNSTKGIVVPTRSTLPVSLIVRGSTDEQKI